MSDVVLQGEVELIRRYRGVLAEILVLGVGFAVGVAVLGGSAALMIGF